MKSIGQLLLGLITALGSTLLVLSAASLSLLEGGVPQAMLPSATPTPLSTSVPGLTQTTSPEKTLTLTPTQMQITRCQVPYGWAPYVVQPGDTLEIVAEQFGLTAQRVRRANCLSSASLIPNTILYLPGVQPTPTAPTALPTVPPTSTPTITQTPTPRPTACVIRAGWVPYRVRSGDTLFGLSVALGISQFELQSANCMTSLQLYAGQILYVPFIPPVRTAVPTNTPTEAPVPTDTPETPTHTPTTAVPPTQEPTETPQPTETPRPTATNTTEPSPTPVTPTVTTPAPAATTPAVITPAAESTDELIEITPNP